MQHKTKLGNFYSAPTCFGHIPWPKHVETINYFTNIIININYYKYYQYGPLITEFNSKVTYRYRCGPLIIIPIHI